MTRNESALSNHEAGGSAWAVIYVAPNQELADMLRELLAQAGYLAVTRAAGIPHLGASGPFEILVPRVEAREAQQALQAILSSNEVFAIEGDGPGPDEQDVH